MKGVPEDPIEIGGVRIPVPRGESHSLSACEKSLVAHLVCLLRPRVVVELGVHRAVTTTFLCDVLAVNEIHGRVWGFDLEDVVADCRAQNSRVRDLEQNGSLQLVPGPLPGTLTTFLEELGQPIDFAVIDALHNYPSVRSELDLLWRHLRPGGYIVVDDYLERTDGVRWAVDAFVSRHSEAMCVPVLSNADAEAAGVQSKLALVTRRPYPYSDVARFRLHDVPAIKAALLRRPTIRACWSLVRPVFARVGWKK